jgi:hypothetical protein
MENNFLSVMFINDFFKIPPGKKSDANIREISLTE